MTHSNEIAILRQQIRTAMDAGRAWDRISDNYFASGRINQGTYAGNVAMKSYTRAEQLSIELEELQG